MHTGTLIVSAFGLSFVCFPLAPRAAAQCHEWAPGFDLQDIDGPVRAFAAFDDGSGPALYVGGQFHRAGGVVAHRMAKWDGVQWAPLGDGITPADPSFGYFVDCLAVYDDGSGSALYAAGNFPIAGALRAQSIAKWDGASWSPLGDGLNSHVSTLEVYDDGSGPKLYAGGSFTVAGGSPVNGIAAWDGVSWSDVGGGVTGISPSVRSLVVHDDGSGPALYAGGRFTTAGATSAQGIARWNGVAWTALGGGLSNLASGMVGFASKLAVYDDGAPGSAKLIVAGSFDDAGGVGANNIAAWNGASFAPLATGNPLVPTALIVSDIGGADELYVGDDSSVRKWNGASWASAGIVGWKTPLSGALVLALGEFDDGHGKRVYVGGFMSVDHGWMSTGLVALDGTTTHPAMLGGDGVQSGRSVLALTVHDDGAGPSLIAGGNFVRIGSVAAPAVARWDGSEWSALGSVLQGAVHSFATFADGTSCSSLYAGGSFGANGPTTMANIARWNGATWSPLVDGVNHGVVGVPPEGVAVLVRALQPFGGHLYVGGSFAAAGNLSVRNFVRWSGSNWSSAGGFSGGEGVYAMTVYDDPGLAPPKLIVAGDFFQVTHDATVTESPWIACFDGSTWAPVATNTLPGIVHALAVFDDETSTGDQLYAGGDGFLHKLVGSTWTPVGRPSIAGGSVRALHEVEPRDPNIPLSEVDFSVLTIALEVAGETTLIEWDGVTLVPVAELDGPVYALHGFDSSVSQGGTDLYAGGRFLEVEDVPAQGIARRIGCMPDVGVGFCYGDGSLGVPCPCAPPDSVPNPSGASDAGCANSLDVDGARLRADGTLDPDYLRFTARIAECYGGYALMVKGDSVAANGIASGDGLRCASGALIRFGGHNAGTNGAPVGSWTFPNAVQWMPVSNLTAQPIGQTAYYQCLYRNPTPGFCSPGTYNLTNGIRIDW